MKNTKKTQILKTAPDPERRKTLPVLVVISGSLLDIGRMLRILDRTQTIGRDSSADFCLNDDQISRKHISVSGIQKLGNEVAIRVEDLGSTNGTYLKGKRVTTGWCKLGETITIGKTTFLFRNETLKQLQTPSYPLRLISKDSLTGVYNRRAFDELLMYVHKDTAEKGMSYSLLLIDVDRFKKVNDQFGHPIGDNVLKKIASKLKGGIRSTDILARVGGEEFAILLSGEGVLDAYQLAERLRKSIQNCSLKSIHPELKNVTISIGIAARDTERSAPDEVYRNADSALYDAKDQGRNQTRIFSKPLD